jgi:hypothetical protein
MRDEPNAYLRYVFGIQTKWQETQAIVIKMDKKIGDWSSIEQKTYLRDVLGGIKALWHPPWFIVFGIN